MDPFAEQVKKSSAISVRRRNGRFAGRVVAVTGGARGQGRGHALGFAAEGADVVLLDLCAPIESVPYRLPEVAELERTAREIEALDRRVFVERVDVRDETAMREAVAAAAGELGRIDVVLANAGIVSAEPFLEMSGQVWRDVIDVNLTGVFNTLQAAGPYLLEAAPGSSVCVTGSLGSVRPVDNLAHYTAAKHGVLGLMKAFAKELGPKGVRANAVLPTQVSTTMTVNDKVAEFFCPDAAEPTAEDLAAASERTHLLATAWTEIQDITDAVLFLCSDEARYITGAALPIDCGALLL